ncbi:hypothetical protein Acy02nite_48880 [Actinoplanes cyaneus]|uniref:Uncharacterized protein n=1 Tax=Actinoplanes cyaneus TaxID=52696 RepID=A0A919IMF5_9ACTN|nr:hypothetical protein [Actinoplanes cyaneus]GID67007.1 hypothetical protein Acy02nite_48880 [Actinoplanes cyaneus]
MHDELVATGRALLIAPLPNRGLPLEHLDAIEAFVSDTTAPDIGGADPDASETARRLLGDSA